MTEPLWLSSAARTNRVEPPRPVRFALIGTGWRSRVYLDIAAARPDLFTVAGVLARSPERATLARARGLPIVTDLAALLATEPEFVVVSVPWSATPDLTRELAARSMHVLAETPPAPDLDGLRSLWVDVGEGGLVAVAEQYPRMPMTSAVENLISAGLIGDPDFVHVSSTHGYHAIAMMRSLLGVGMGVVEVSAHSAATTVVDPLEPSGWTGDVDPRPAEHTLATLVFDGGSRGLYDFTSNQWWNPLRTDHLTVRGTRGEVHDDVVVRMLDATTVARSVLTRSMTGHGMNLEGSDTTTVTLDGRVHYRNRYEGGRLSDDELAVAELLSDAGEWARGSSDAPYSLADASQDHAISLAIARAAVAGPQTVPRQPWAR